MIVPLLSTKSRIPNLPAEYIPRLDLYEKLSKTSGMRLILVSAPPGFGKTTIVVDWLHRLQHPAAWLSLDQAENDPIRFFAYLAAVLESVDSQLVAGTQVGLGATPVLPADLLIINLINDISSFGRQVTLVLDDYHLISNPVIHQAMALLIDRQPANLQLVLITREDPPLPLSRLRAQRFLIEIRESDLRFSLEEAAEFLSQTMGVDLSSRSVADLVKRTEGWVAGLQMAGLALSSQALAHPTINAEDFIAAFRGDDRYVMDYLMDEVFQRQPRHIQEFLLNTSIAERLNASLCDQLIKAAGAGSTSSSQAEDQNSQQILEILERMNLFLLPLDTRREWYRYHHLFADLLAYRLKREHPERLAELHRRASAWFLREGGPDEAMQQALAAPDGRLHLTVLNAGMGKLCWCKLPSDGRS